MSTTSPAIRQSQLQNWALVVKECRDSGLKVVEYCRQKGITKDMYYYWFKKVREEFYTQNGFVEIPQADICKEEKPISKSCRCLSDDPSDERIDIRKGDLTVSVPLSVTRETLTMIIGAVDHAE